MDPQSTKLWDEYYRWLSILGVSDDQVLRTHLHDPSRFQGLFELRTAAMISTAC